MLTAPDADRVFRALADPTRRSLYEHLSRCDESTVAELTRTSGVSQGAVSQHLKALREAGLVVDRPDGRHVHYRATADGLAPLTAWIDFYRGFWRERLANLRATLKDIDP